MKRLLLLLIMLFLFSCTVQQEREECNPELIAHAGGGVGNHIYTNSREAMEQALENGYRFIEFDLQFTSDSVLVAAHSWSDFNSMTGFAHWGDSVPSYNEFSARKICGAYTPLSAHEINAFFESNNGLFLVTDKISEPEVLERYFPNLKERMVVEAFSFKHYQHLKSEGYFRVLYSCMAQDLTSTLFSTSLKEIDWLALHTSGFENPVFKFIENIHQFDIALFTVDNMDSIPAEYKGMVKMVYTNFIKP